jgi:hypothetical protein
VCHDWKALGTVEITLVLSAGRGVVQNDGFGTSYNPTACNQLETAKILTRTEDSYMA